MGAKNSKSELALGTTPSHGNPQSTSSLNTELNNVARNTNDTSKARALVEAGADLSSTNGPTWRHTPLHQAAYHGRYEMAKTLVDLGARLDLHSNPCGRGATGTPLELARGGGHHKIAAMLEKAAGIAPTSNDKNAELAAELAQAAWDGDVGKVRSLLNRGAPPNTETYHGFSNGHHSALNGAARNGHTDIVTLLLEQPVKPDIESRCQGPWEVTPLQQAGYHGRAECAKILLKHGASTTSRSGPGCQHQTAKEIAQQMRNGQWRELVAAIDAHGGVEKATGDSNSKGAGGRANGTWKQYSNIDMCCQGDAEIIGDWKRHHTIESLQKIVEEKGYSAVCVGSFGHAALKSFDYQLTAENCAPSQGYTNTLYIWFPDENAKPPKPAPAPRPDLPAGFSFAKGFGEATRADQIAHIGPGLEHHCFGGDKYNWPLQWAAMIGDVAAIETLVAAGHDPNVKMPCWFDAEPLGWAASFGQCKAIEALCAAGADPRRPANTSGNTPLSDAQREGHTKAIELLQEYLSGARPIGKPVAPPMSQIAVGTPVAGVAASTPPPLHEIVAMLRAEFGLPADLPMAKVVDRAVAELGVDVGKGAAILQTAEAAWKALHVAHDGK